MVQLSTNLWGFLLTKFLFFSLPILIKQNKCHLKIKMITFPIATSTKWQILKEAKNRCWLLEAFWFDEMDYMCNWISIYIYVYSLHVCIFLCILLWFHSESKSNGCVDKTNLVQTGMDKDMLNMAVLIYVRGRPLRMHACIHFEIEILVASLSLIQLALSTCKHFKSNTSTVEKW